MLLPDVLVALGLVLVIEGLSYSLFPARLKGMMLAMQKLSDDQLRIGGIMAMAAGVAVVWVVRGAFF